MDNWNTIETLEITTDINSIHVDTRDFHVLTSKENRDFKIKGQKYLIPVNKIKDWLLNIQEISGGKGTWRLLNFKHIDANGWFKYISLYRNDDDNFIVCDRNGNSIMWQLMTEKNLEKEYLSLIQCENHRTNSNC